MNLAIYLLRHGEIDLGGQKRYVGQVDFPLSDQGLSQARHWREKLACTAFEGIYCSNLIRSLDTARIIAGGDEKRVHILSELREINLGEWDGLSVAEVRSRYPEEWEKRGQDLAGYRPPCGESFADLHNRVLPIFDDIVRTLSGKVLMVAHAGVKRVILCHILGMPLANLFRLGQDYGRLSVVDCERRPLRLLAMNIADPHPFMDLD
jgi:alpha-ribazole phosphatase